MQLLDLPFQLADFGLLLFDGLYEQRGQAAEALGQIGRALEDTRGSGAVSARMALNTQMGLGHERYREDLKAWASDFRLSESNHRQFYRRWLQLMTAGSWAEL